MAAMAFGLRRAESLWKSMWKEYTTSFRRVWLGNLYELVLCCANTYEMQIMNAMNAHRGV
jgi:hypothetical protein